MKRLHVVGLAMWRGGWLLAVGYIAFEALRAILSIADPQLELAVSVLLTGVVFVFLSIVAERVADARQERKDLE
jgi:hypothetical protein